MAQLRRSKEVVASLNAKWLKYAVNESNHRPARWILSEDGKTIERDYGPSGPPHKSARNEEAYKEDGTWWLMITKGKGETKSIDVKEIIPLQHSKASNLFL